MRIVARLFISASVTLAVAVSGVSVATARPAPAVQKVEKSTHSELQYSARDVVSFFLLSTGPLFDSHPQLASDLGLHYQDVPDEVINQVLDAVEAIDRNFDQTVVEPIQSGDPLRGEAALTVLSEIAEQLASPSAVRATARGWFYTTNYIATINVAGGALVAVVAGAAVVAAIAVVLYSPAENLTRFERELRTLTITKAL